jgi:hypothetical protein
MEAVWDGQGDMRTMHLADHNRYAVPFPLLHQNVYIPAKDWRNHPLQQSLDSIYEEGELSGKLLRGYMRRLRISREVNKSSTRDLPSRCQRTRVNFDMLLHDNVCKTC